MSGRSGLYFGQMGHLQIPYAVAVLLFMAPNFCCWYVRVGVTYDMRGDLKLCLLVIKLDKMSHQQRPSRHQPVDYTVDRGEPSRSL